MVNSQLNSFTPVGIDRPTIAFPGVFGGTTWSGISIDPERRVMVANVIHFPMYNRLIRRPDANPADYRQFDAGRVPVNSARWSQTGTPYVASIEPFPSDDIKKRLWTEKTLTPELERARTDAWNKIKTFPRNIELQVDPKLFELPADYKRIDEAELLKQMRPSGTTEPRT